MNILEQLTLFGVDKVAEHLNGQGDDISVDKPIITRPSPSPLSRLSGRIPIEHRATSIYESHCGGLFAFLGCEDERELARVFHEFGELRDGGNYESLEVTFPQPIRTESGILIPRSHVRLYAEIQESNGNLRCQRQDYLKRWGIWRKANLQEILPDELFMTSAQIPYIIQHTR